MIRQIILTYTYGGINRSFSGRLLLSVIFDYPANSNRSLVRIIGILLYMRFQKQLTNRKQHPCISPFPLYALAAHGCLHFKEQALAIPFKIKP
jgi:hypothetical protein